MSLRRHLTRFSSATFLLCIWQNGIYAQTLASGTQEPEVRRAIPVTDFHPPDQPPAEIPVLRALPAGTPLPIPPPTQSPSPTQADTASTPSTQSPPSMRLIMPEEIRSSSPHPELPTEITPRPVDTDGSIRIAPSVARNPEELAAAQLAVADGLFTRKQPESAVPEYEKFLAMASMETKGREHALYRLGESQRLMENVAAAEATFNKLLEEYPGGEFDPSAAFRLGELREARGNFPDAAGDFNRSSKGATDPSIRLAAMYREAICRDKNGQKDQSEMLFKSLAQSAGESSYKTAALLQLASSAVTAGKKEEALVWYNQILSAGSKANLSPEGISPEALSEATVKAAILQSELGNSAESKKLFERVASSKDSGQWQGLAALGVLRLAAQSGDDGGVLKDSDRAMTLNPDSKAEILLLQANSFRKLGKNSKAIEDYDQIIREFPGSKAASSAPFQRLLALYAARKPSLNEEIDQYLLTAADPGDRAKAQLLKAEETLRNGKFKDAAQLYHTIPTDSLSPASKLDILYKEAWSLTQAGEKESAISALTRFLEANPDEERAPAALAQRGILKQQQNDLAGATADFSLLQERYPKATERELALQQKGLLLGQQQDNKGMVEAFTLLLHDYPKSRAVPQAHYWIGWTAMENKDYQTAVTELSMARAGDPKEFGERAGLRILLAEYYQNRPEEAAREAVALKSTIIPPEVGRWLGLKAMESGDPSKAERFLAPLAKEGMPGSTDTEIQATLASSLVAEGKFHEAQTPATACLKLARDPASRARALLVAATIQRSMKNIPQASSMVDEAMTLQPEGSINAEARILSGDLLMSQRDYASAAKAYMTVGVLYDDPVLTPKALAKALDAYRRSGNETEARKALCELQKRFPNAPLPPMPKS